MQELEEEGLGGDVGGGGLTWQQNTQIIKLSFEAYRHGKSRTHAELNLPYLQLHTSLVCRLQFGSLLQKMRMVEVTGSMFARHFTLSMRLHDWIGMFIYVWTLCAAHRLSDRSWHLESWLCKHVHGCIGICLKGTFTLGFQSKSSGMLEINLSFKYI